MSTNNRSGLLAGLSNEIADLLSEAAESIVRVDDGTRLTATGLVWSSDGLVITTSHGVERDEEVSIVTGDGSRVSVTVAGRDPEADIALLRADGAALKPIALADNDDVRAGHLVLAAARPGIAGLQAALGIVTSRMDAESGGRAEYVLQTDAEMQPGFSGGALLNARGQLVGMIDLGFRRGRGIALGTPMLQHVAEGLAAHGRVSRGYLGISTHFVALPANLKENHSLSQTHGLLLSNVAPGSPAEQAGLYLGDVAVAFDGNTMDEPETLRRILRSRPAGTPVTLQVLRGGAMVDVPVTLGEQPE